MLRTMKMKLKILAACVLLLTPTAMAQTNLELSAVFTERGDGYHTYRIPALIVTTNGTVLAFCEGRKNSRSDTGDIDLLVKRSTDGGRNWSAQQLIWSDGENTCGNPTPVVDQTTGVIWLLATWNSGADKEKEIDQRASRNTRRAFAFTSTDDGLTWSKPLEITASVKKPAWGWYATGPGNGIQLTRGEHRGRLIIPANHSERPSNSTNAITRSHVFYSDDHGKTWRLGGIEEEQTNESTLAELSDGTLLHNMRSYHKENRRAVATSKDGGATWSPVKLDEALIEPVCQASLLRGTWAESGKNRLLFSNPASVKREKLTVRVSYDEGQTWPVSKLIYDGPAAYSSLTILPDQSVACLFECGKKTSYETITMARFPLSWLEETPAAR
jgi:sialidase-1